LGERNPKGINRSAKVTSCGRRALVSIMITLFRNCKSRVVWDDKIDMASCEGTFIDALSSES